MSSRSPSWTETRELLQVDDSPLLEFVSEKLLHPVHEAPWLFNRAEIEALARDLDEARAPEAPSDTAIVRRGRPRPE